MENIEIKAKFADLDKGVALARTLGATDEGVLHQIDTYFNVREGRLKLREINTERAELIFYKRTDEDGPKSSRYQILPIADPNSFKAMMDEAVGIWTVVEKHRRLFLYDEVRIHLDDVSNLGTFLEFEGVVQNEATKDATGEKVRYLLREFSVLEADLLSGSYSDLLQRP